jgi:hypothetical protein
MDLGAEEPLMEKQVLFSERSAGFTLYRIPGIIVTGHGTVLVYCEARKHSVADRGEIEITCVVVPMQGVLSLRRSKLHISVRAYRGILICRMRRS